MPGMVAIATSPQSRSISMKAAPSARVPISVGNALAPWFDPQAPAVAPLNPPLSRLPTMSPSGGGDDESAHEREPGPRQQQTDAEPDQDHRPERPEIADLRVREHPGPNEQGDRAREDEEDAPAQGASSHMHPLHGTRRGGRVLASRPVAAPWEAPMRLSGWVEIAPRPEAVTPKVLAVVEPMLAMLGCRARSAVLGGLGRRPRASGTRCSPPRTRVSSRSMHGSTSPAKGRGPAASSSAGRAPRSATWRSRCRAVTAS